MNYYKKHFDLRIKVQIESTSSFTSNTFIQESKFRLKVLVHLQVIRLFKNQSSIKSTSLLPVKR